MDATRKTALVAGFLYLLTFTPFPPDVARPLSLAWLLGLVFALRMLAHWPWVRHGAVNLADRGQPCSQQRPQLATSAA